MFAVVLVGGFGSRLRPLTYEIPKPMLPIVHRPMIVRLIERLAEAGVTDVALALGFKPEPFAEAFPDNLHVLSSGRAVRVHYAVEPEPLDTGGAIAFAARHCGVDSTFVVANGDIVTDLPVADLVRAHREGGRHATIHLTPVPDPSAFGVVECNGDGAVRRFVEKPAPGETDSNLINAGTYVFEPEVLDLIPVNARVSIERDTFPKLAAANQLGGYATDDYWIDAGRPELFLTANLDLIDGTRGTPEPAVASTATLAPDAIVDRSVIGEHSVVGAGSELRGSVLLPNATVGRGSTIVGSIVAGEVGEGVSLTDCVIGPGYCVPAGTALTGERLPAP